MTKPSEEDGAPAAGAELVRGGRVLLRRPLPADQEEYQALRRASADFHRPWEPLPQPGLDPYGEEAFLRYLGDCDSAGRQRTLLCGSDDGALLGGINFNEIVRGSFQSAYLGYWIGVEHARRGYMHEGLRLALRYAFKALSLHRVEANICPENTASIALVRSCGFRREGLSPSYLQIAGEWRDHERWAFLAEDL